MLQGDRMWKNEPTKTTKSLKVVVSMDRAEGDPPFSFWRVELTNDEGVWTEAFGSEDMLRAFLRGFTAACSFSGVYFPQPEIPRLPL